MRTLTWGLPGMLLGALLVVGCGPTEKNSPPPDELSEETQPPLDDDATTTTDTTTPVDAGTTTPVDAGQPDTAKDAGTPPDAGTQDAGTPVDAGTPPVDAGTEPVIFPSLSDWTFYGPQHGLPNNILGVTSDEGGNIWVAGGEAGLFLLRPGATTFENFTMADGLRPYGYMPDGSAPVGDKYLNVISVEGGPAGTVFVGYKGKPPAAGEYGCEDNWDGPNPDPAIYKSGDADKVTLTSTGINVVHYDIFSGPNVVSNELRGREKLCDVMRIVWDKAAARVWFGANHGFAMGSANYTGNNTCNGQLSCTGVLEHVHPAINAWRDESRTGAMVLLTADYRGVAVDPNTHDVFFGGMNRSTLFKWGTYGGMSNAEGAYWPAQTDTEGTEAGRWDLWPDASPEPTPSERVDDLVFGAATTGDGTFWVGSAARGLAHVSNTGVVLATLKNELAAPHVSAVAADTDGSIWVGARWGGGLTRIKNGQITKYSWSLFGAELASAPVSDIQVMTAGGGRKLLVGFEAQPDKAGAVGVYSGN